MKRSINYYTSIWNDCVLIIFMLAISLNASAQWTRTNGPYGGPLNCILKNSNDFYSGTIAGVFHSNNDGINWNHSLEVDTTFSLELHGSDILAGCNDGLYISSNAGVSWTNMSSGLPNSAVLSLESFNGMLFAGTRQGIYKSTDNGVTWLSSNIGLPLTRINKILGVGSNIFIATTLGIYRSNNSGLTWSAINTGITGISPSYGMTSIAANGSVIYSCGVASNGIVFKSTDNGDNWVIIGTSSQFITGLPFAISVSGTNIIVGGYAGSGAIFHSNNNGTTWLDIGQNNAYVAIRDIFFDGGTLYQISDVGISRSSNFGVNWENIGLGKANFVNVLTSYNSSIIAGTQGGIYISNDNGLNWQRSNSGFPGGIEIIEDIAINGLDIYCCSWIGGVYKSTDGGNSWQSINNGLPTNVPANIYSYGITTLNGEIFVSITSGNNIGVLGVYKSLDDGANWANSSTGLPSLGGVAIQMGASSPVIYTSGYFGIYLSTDMGDNWTISDPDIGYNVLKVFGTNVYSYKSSGDLFVYSNNYGSSWNSNITPYYFGSIAGIESHLGNIFIAGSSGGGPPPFSCIYKTSNNGLTWTALPIGIEDCDSFKSLLSHNGNLFAGRGSCNHQPNGVFRYTGLVSVEEIPESNLNLYPNPANDNLNIIGITDRINSIEIYDISGKLVSSVANPNNTISISDLSNGTYLIKIKTDENEFWKKFEVVR